MSQSSGVSSFTRPEKPSECKILGNRVGGSLSLHIMEVPYLYSGNAFEHLECGFRAKRRGQRNEC